MLCQNMKRQIVSRAFYGCKSPPRTGAGRDPRNQNGFYSSAAGHRLQISSHKFESRSEQVNLAAGQLFANLDGGGGVQLQGKRANPGGRGA